MAIKRVLIGGQMLAVDTETGALLTQVSGITFDGDVNIGDIHLLDGTDQKINPATQETLAAVLAKLIAAPATEAKQDAIVAAIKHAATYHTVPIAQGTTPGIVDLTAGLTLTGKVARLHKLVGTLHAAGSVQIAYDDDGAGMNAVALSGAMTLDPNAGPAMPFEPHAEGCPATAAAKHLTLVSVGGAFNGSAVISLSDA